MIKLLALASIAAMLAACAPTKVPSEQRQAMGAAAAQPMTEGAAVAASLGFHGPKRSTDKQGADWQAAD